MGRVLLLASCSSHTLGLALGIQRHDVTTLWVKDAQVIRIAELQPPYLPNYAPFYVYLIATLGLLATQSQRRRWWECLAIGLFAFLGLRYLRFTPLLLCASAPLVAAELTVRVGASRVLPLVSGRTRSRA